jgi:drug/metabolite transporter (DMT)-like permease
MKYLYLALTCTLFSVQFIFTKLFSRRAGNAPHVGLWNGAVIALLMFCYLMPLNGFVLEFSPAAVLLALLLALCAITMNLCNIPAMRLGNLAVVTTYMLVGGMVLPFVYGVAVLKEACPPLKVIAIAVLLLAILPNLFQGKAQASAGQKDGLGRKLLFHGLCLVLFTLNGMTSILTTVHSLHENKISAGGFTMLSALFQLGLALLVLFVYAVYLAIKGNRGALRTVFYDVGATTPTRPRTLCLLAGIAFAYAVCNGVANIFSQESLAAGMDSSVQFPVISGAVIVMSALFGQALFGERIDRYTAISLALSVVGSVLFILA